MLAATDVVLRRIGRLADGWTLVGPAGPHVEEAWGRIREFARQAGRDPSALGLEGVCATETATLTGCGRSPETWRRLGASYVCVSTMGAGLRSLPEHVAALEKVYQALQ